MRKKDSNQVSTLLMVGVGGLVLGIFMIMFGILSSMAVGQSGMALAGLGILFSLGGGGLALGSVLYGIRQERGDSRETRVTTIENVQITARFGMNRLGETIFDADFLDFDDPKTKLFIRISTPTSGQVELRTSSAVWGACGEGMRGIAHVQGDWLGQFERVATPPPTGNPYIKE